MYKTSGAIEIEFSCRKRLTHFSERYNILVTDNPILSRRNYFTAIFPDVTHNTTSELYLVLRY